MHTNATTTKLVKQRKGYLVVEGGEVYRKHCLTPRDASGYIHRAQNKLAHNSAKGNES